MTMHTRRLLGVHLCLFGAMGAVTAQADWAYLGQTPPGDEARQFAPEIMQHNVHSSPTFGPDGREMYWSTVCQGEQARRIVTIKYRQGQWEGPFSASFASHEDEDQPFMAYDGSRMVFSSNRQSSAEGLNLWSTARVGEAWTPPVPLALPITSERGQWTPSMTRDGTLCFTAHMEDMRNGFGIYLSRYENGQYRPPEALPKCINRRGPQNWTPWIAPDGSFILFASGRQPKAGAHDIFVSYRADGTWTEPINLGPKVNTIRQERFPGLSPDGKYLFFTRHYDAPCYHDLYWIEAGAVLPHLQGRGESAKAPGAQDQEKAQPDAEMVWQTPAVFRTPEAVLYDRKRDVLYVSNFNVDGGFLAGRTEPRRREFISKIDTTGNVLALKWVIGLEAPTGMAIQNDTLYVVERNNLVEIDIEDARIIGRCAIPDASFANDIAMNAPGVGYISDNGRQATTGIYRYADGRVEPWIPATQVSRPNGLLVDGSELIAYDNNRQALVGIGRADRQVRTIATIASEAGGMGDGLVKLNEGTYLVTAWSGPSWLVRPDGSATALLDTNQLKPVSGERVNNADCGFVPKKNLWVIPTFMDHRLLAYELKTSGN